jgi:hypothetical protein
MPVEKLLVWFLIYFQRSETLSKDLVHLPYPHDQIIRSIYGNKVKTITSDEYNQITPCSFIGQIHQLKNHHRDPSLSPYHQTTAKCNMESIEHSLVQKYISSSSNAPVLEIGGRYGTTSCTIASQLNNSGNLVVVEPDSRVWSALEINRQTHFCNFYLVKKPIGNSSVQIIGKNYDSLSEPLLGLKSSPFDHQRRPNYYNYRDLKVVKLTFKTLLIDCEGCLNYLFLSKDSSLSLNQILKHVNLIILEADNSDQPNSPCVRSCVNYSDWVMKFDEVGLDVVEKVADKKFPWIEHMVFQRRGRE